MSRAAADKQKRRATVPAPETKSPSRRDRYFWVLIGILMLGAALRLYAVETANFWLDELWTIELSCGNDTAHEHLPLNTILSPAPAPTSLATAKPWWSVWTSLDQVTHPPLFFLLLRGWREVFGSSDMAVRLLPCIASIGAIALLYALVRRLSGPRAAICSALIMALAGQQIFYAQEVRSYSLIVALGLGCALALVHIEKQGVTIGRLLVLGLLVFATLLAHYFTVGLIAAFFIYVMTRFRGPSRWKVATTFAAAGLLFAIVWGPFMLRQRGAMSLQGEGAAAFLLEQGPGHVWNTILRVLAVPGQSISPASFMAPATLPSPVSWIVLPAFVVPIVFIRRRPELLLWYLWFAGVVLPLAALDLGRSSMHLAFPRYTLLAGPAVFAVVGAGWDSLGSPIRCIAPATVLIACAVLLPASLRQPQSKDEWPQLVAMEAGQRMGPGDALVVTAPPDQAAIVYLYVSQYLGPIDRPVVILTRTASPQLAAELRSHAHVWVINRWPDPMPELVPGARFEQAEWPLFGQLVWPAGERK